MARMVPFPMLPTESSAERRLYEGFLEQLGDDYVVYHSVDWVLGAATPGGGVVQGEADFIVSHPVDGILVIEAKGGQLAYDPSTRQWSQAGHSGRHHLDEDPFHQARDEMNSLIEIVSHQPGWDRWQPSYGYAVALPDGLLEHDAHPAARAAWAIDRDDMQRLDERIREVMRAWRQPGRRFGTDGMDALERALGFRVEVRTPLGLQFDHEDRRIFELTNDQAYVLATVSKLRRAAVVGPAGSGKTMLAIAIAARLARGGNATLLTCASWRLADQLRRSLQGTPTEIHFFHELCTHIASQAGLSVPEEPPEGAPDRDDHFERVLPDLLEQGAKILGPQYDAMVVDQGQDFRPEWWPILLSLHRKPVDGPLFLFSDDNLNLDGQTPPQGLADLTLELPENLRNPKPIHEFVSVFYRGGEKPTARPSGRPVDVLGYKDEDELTRLLGRVLKNLEHEGVPLEDIVVLTPTRRNESALRRRGSANGYQLSDAPGPGKVLTSNVHGFKGLERPVVILAEIGEREREKLARYLYVGGSRARDHLIVLAADPVARELRKLAGVQAG